MSLKVGIFSKAVLNLYNTSTKTCKTNLLNKYPTLRNLFANNLRPPSSYVSQTDDQFTHFSVKMQNTTPPLRKWTQRLSSKQLQDLVSRDATRASFLMGISESASRPSLVRKKVFFYLRFWHLLGQSLPFQKEAKDWREWVWILCYQMGS